jgi:hypothetical protein
VFYGRRGQDTVRLISGGQRPMSNSIVSPATTLPSD